MSVTSSSWAILSGILTHLVLWIHGEWDPYSGYIAVCAIITHNILFLLLRFYFGLTYSKSFSAAAYLELLHMTGTATSIVLYRIFFHRLRHFPGPWFAKIWIWYIFIRTWFSGHRQSIVLDELHAEYGPIVRYAPDRVSINLASAVPLVHGTGSTSLCTKSVVYLNPVNGGSINADRDVESHHDRRKLWERALSTRSLPDYIPAFVRHTFALSSMLRSTRGCTVNVNHYVRLFTFDVMGEIGFGRQGGFDGLNTGILHPAVATLIDMMGIGVYMMLVPWLHVLADYVPAMGIIYRPDELFRDFATETLGQYYKSENMNEPKRKIHADLLGDQRPMGDGRSFRDLLSQIHPNSHPGDRRTLSDCVLLAIAGADTTTSSIVHILYRLARHTAMQSKVYEEILDASVPPSNSCAGSEEALFASWAKTAKLPYLEAFIREVLRLHPPAPTGLPRLTPPEGLVIQQDRRDPVFIPGSTNVSIPVYTLLRDPRNFKDPLTFFPQRFLPSGHPDARPNLVLDGRAYIPFLQGPYGCAGKHFAYLEMKIVIAGLVRSFEIALPEAVDAASVDQVMDTQWRDFSTVKAAPLSLRFVPRVGSTCSQTERSE